MKAPAWWFRNLSYGDVGPDVRHAQVLLKGETTGVFDHDTVALVRGLQHSIGATPNGEIDYVLACALGDRATRGLVPEWWSTDIDLTPVPDLADAVRRFQSANSLTPSGVIDAETARRIGE